MSTAEDMSITATDATVAGSSVAITEAEEDGSLGISEHSNNTKKLIITKDALLDISIFNDYDDEVEEGYTAPMHLHALRTPAILKGAPRSRSSSRSRPGSRPGSRRNSLSPPRAVGAGEIIAVGSVSPSVSTSSSLDGIGDHDPDILLDKLGFRDLDADVTQEEMQDLLRKKISISGLQTLNERMSEDSMDDSQAFKDLKFVSKKSKEAEDIGGEDTSPERLRRGGLTDRSGLSSSAIVGSMSYLLSTLDEDEGEDEGDEDDDGGDIILKIPEGMLSGKTFNEKENRDSVLSTMAVANESSIGHGRDVDDDNAVEVPDTVLDELGRRKQKNRDTSNAQAGIDLDFLEDDEHQEGINEGEDSEDGDVVLQIPTGMVSSTKSNRKVKNRDSLVSTTAVANATTSYEDDEIDDDAEVIIPSSVMKDMNISEERRKLKREDTMVAQTGGDLDYLEADEQDGLDADLANGR